MTVWQPTVLQMKAIAMLANAETVKAVAVECSVTERTVWNWRRIPEFRQAVRDRLAEELERAVTIMARSAPKAARMLERVSDGESIDSDTIAVAQWLLTRFSYITEGLAVDPQPGLVLQETRTISASGQADIAELVSYIQDGRDAKQRLLIESAAVVEGNTTTDPPSG